MEGFLNKVFIEPFKGFLENMAGFLPNLLTGVVLIIVGLVTSWLLKEVIVRAARFLKIDIFSERFGVAQVLLRSGIKEPVSKLIGRLVFWVVFISFIITGLDTLKVSVVEDLLGRFLLYLPSVIAAGLVVIFGYLLGNFLGRAVLIASVNAGLAVSAFLGKLVKFTVFMMSVSMALELLGIGKETVLIAFAIIFGGAVLALSIAFGIGGKDAAKNYIEKMLREKKDKDDIQHI